MKLRTLVLLGAAGWLYTKMPRDPRTWPAFVGEHVALLKEQVAEATEEGKKASERRQEQIDREVMEAMGRQPGQD